MTLVLNATPGGATSNAYCTVSEADAYHEGHFYAEPWEALSPPDKAVALVHATRLLNQHVGWYGTKTTSTQALPYPRTGVVDPDAAVGETFFDPYSIPVWLKEANAEMARCLSVEDRTVESDMLEYTEMSIGVLSLVKDKGSKKEVLPESVRAMVGEYGVVTTLAGIGLAKLVRA